MAVDKLVDSSQLDANLTLIANAIRTKSGTSVNLSFPNDFITAINAISGDGGGGVSREIIAAEQTVTASEYFTALTGSEGLVDGEVYSYTVDGTEYIGMAVPNSGMLYVNSGFTYAIGDYSGSLFLVTQSTGQHTVKVEELDLSGGSGGTNQDYEDALTAFGVQSNLASGITALTTYANEITGESDATLSDAVRSLADGYGQGGPLTLISTTTFDDLPEYTDTSSWEAYHDTGINIKNTDYAFGLIVITCDAAITTSTEWGMTVAPFGRYTSNGNIFTTTQLQQKGSSTLSKTQMVNATVSNNAYGVIVTNNTTTVRFQRKCHSSAMPKIRGGTYTVKVYALASF